MLSWNSKDKGSPPRKGVFSVHGQDGGNKNKGLPACHDKLLPLFTLKNHFRYLYYLTTSFDEVSVDFAHVNGETLLLVIGDYSTFPFVNQFNLRQPMLSFSNWINCLLHLELTVVLLLMKKNLPNLLMYLDLSIARLLRSAREPMGRLKDL